MDYFLGTLFVIICVLLIVVVLLQKGRGGGLGAAFGGSSSSAFGTKIGDVFTWVTIVLTALFLLLAIGVAVTWRPTVVINPPSIAPAGGPVMGPTMVTIESEHKQDGGRIWYTLDGTDPADSKNEARKEYIEAFMVEPGTTVRAVVAHRGRTSKEIQASYTEFKQPTLPTASEEVITAPATPETPEAPATPTEPAAVTVPAAPEAAAAATTVPAATEPAVD